MATLSTKTPAYNLNPKGYKHKKNVAGRDTIWMPDGRPVFWSKPYTVTIRIPD